MRIATRARHLRRGGLLAAATVSGKGSRSLCRGLRLCGTAGALTHDLAQELSCLAAMLATQEEIVGGMATALAGWLQRGDAPDRLPAPAVQAAQNRVGRPAPQAPIAAAERPHAPLEQARSLARAEGHEITCENRSGRRDRNRSVADGWSSFTASASSDSSGRTLGGYIT